MSVQVVQNYVDFPSGMVGDNAIHVVEEFPAPTARIVPGFDLSGGNIQRGEKVHADNFKTCPAAPHRGTASTAEKV